MARSSRYARVVTAYDLHTILQRLAYGTVYRTASVQYILYSGAEANGSGLNMVYLYKSAVSCFLQCMGYVPREGCMYFQGQSLRKYIQHEGGTHPLHCKNDETTITHMCLGNGSSYL